MKFIPTETESEMVLVEGAKTRLTAALLICAKESCRRPISEALELKLVCPGCDYGHFIQDRVMDGLQTVICAHCAERWNLDLLERLAKQRLL